MANNEMDIFLEALDRQNVRERQAFVEKTCHGNPELAARVRELLEHHENSEAWVRTSAVDFTATFKQNQADSDLAPGSIIGPYTLLEVIGEGGYGEVYAARQERPLKREVALKIIKLGMDTREVIARFEAERQALAMMNHPNIANVLDAGSTPNGRPFFVMDRVHGTPIHEFCDTQRLSPRERIRLFIQVCHGVQHAHQKGLIHRDLKPSNILVTQLESGSSAIPKVIDFGIAKATEDKLTEKTLVTHAEHFLGTPAYVSPEQAEAGMNHVDTRSDLYSMGVVLYELLVGNTPFTAHELREAGPLGMRRIITEKRPNRPSNQVTRLKGGEQARLAELRRLDLSKLFHHLKGDLDRVVMKALEKEKEHRYQTAEALAEDLERYLRHEPVTAIPTSVGYRFKKFTQRNRLGVATAAMISLLIATGVYLNIQETRRATQAETSANINENKARVSAQKSEQTARIMMTMLDAATPSIAAGRDPRILWDILDSTAKRLDSENNLFPEVEAELRAKLAKTMIRIGHNADAEQMLRRSLIIYETLHEDNHALVLDTMQMLCGALANQRKHEECDLLRAKILQILKTKYLGDHHHVSLALQQCALAKIELQRFEEAAAFHRLALEMNQRLMREDDIGLAESFSQMGRILQTLQREDEASAMFEKAMEIARLNNAQIRVAVSLDDQASLAIQKGDFEKALEYYQEALELKKMHQGPLHPDTSHSHAHVAHVLHLINDFARAEPNLRECLMIREMVYPEGHPMVTGAMQSLAHNLNRQGKASEASNLKEKLAQLNSTP